MIEIAISSHFLMRLIPIY